MRKAPDVLGREPPLASQAFEGARHAVSCCHLVILPPIS
ncbi:hypothetical protein Ga0080559_TMP416 (plasmid) [Salipiger profundus]|uniref:Uncharacterized protein n=1 Tax=Salipiger profundus TaxID=1229727 RepID=A0A1U7DCN3_9RHOB|nr:hypothetical protein Ga0080559_TMP416 [Salipiger profundus]